MQTAQQDRPADVSPAFPGISGREDARIFNGIPGEEVSIRIHADQVGGRFSILESVAAPGCSAPLHSHREDEVFYVISGNPTFRLGDEIHEATPGSTVLIPANTPHAWINRTQSELRMLAIFAPGGVEALFPQIAGLPLDQLTTLAASYGTFVLGPPMQP